MAKTKQSTPSRASPASSSNAYANFAAGTGPYPNQNISYNPQTDPTGGYGALSNFDFSQYAGNKGAIKELGQAYGISLSPEQLNLYARNPQSLGSLRAGGTSSYQQGSQQGYGYSGPGGGMVTTGGIPLGTLMMMRGQQQDQGAPPAPGPGPSGQIGSVMNPLPLPSQQRQMVPQQVAQQIPSQVGQQMLQPVQQTITQTPQQQPLSNNVLNPIPIPMQPVQQYQSGGLVRGYQSGGMVDPNLSLGGGGSKQQNTPAPSSFYDFSSYGGNPGAINNLLQTFGVNATGQQLDQYAQNPNLLNSVTPGAGAPGGPGTTPIGATLNQRVFGGQGAGTMYGAGNALYTTNQQGLINTGQPAGYANATNLDRILGAAATYSPMVVPQLPSSQISNKSGVAPVGGALLTAGVPTVPQGPWMTNPGVFAKATPYTPTAAPTITPQTPATSVAYAPGQPFATPPAAPGYTLGSSLPPTMAQSGATTARLPAAMLPPGFMGGAQGAGYVPQAFLEAHTSALADAGKALYSHFGGDPNSASPADIANFHSQLTDAIGQHIAGANQTAVGVKRAATGGLVPGRGSEDTVPALLTPGEYVIPKQQVAQLAARGVLKLQSGGLVQDPDPDPPEVRRQALTVSQPSSSSAQSSSPQVGGGRNLVSGLTQAAQTYGNAFSGSMGGGGRMGGGGGYSADTLGKLGDEGLIGSMGLGKGFGGGGGSPGLQSALGGIGSGLSQAAQAIASSAQPWQVQQSAIPDPSQLPKYQIPTLQPERVA